MPGIDPSFSAKKPVSVWNQPLQADFKGLFGALARAGLHGATGQWVELGSDAVEGLAALGLEKDAPQLAWLLIRRALFTAMGTLVREAAPLLPEPRKDEVKELSDHLDDILEKEQVTIDSSFFARPESLLLLTNLKTPFSKWLQVYGLSEAAADSTASRLSSYFVASLHEEWRKNPAAYEPIREKVDTPFTRAADRERAWALYASRLRRQIDEPMFGEAFGLRQVYVPLRAFYIEDNEERKGDKSFAKEREHPKERRIAVDLEFEIDSWLEEGDRTDGFRILSGGPGSGKSSFTKMYAAKVALDGKIRALFIPLHQFNVSGSLVDAVGEFVLLGEILPSNPLDPSTGENSLLILFDGLDELSQQGRIAAEVARDFLREVQKVVEIRNQSKRRLLVLVTGREPVVQANSSELRDRRNILHALPYLVPDSEKWHKGEELLQEDQRQIWWRHYAKAAGKPYPGLPQELSQPDLDEITAQPLLNYLVALSYGRGQLDFTRDLNLNDIYDDLLKAVHSRTYEDRRQHLAIRGMSLDEFTRALEEIALSAWHGNGRTTTVGEIEAHCKAAGLSGLLERFAEGAKAGVARILTAFYFRQYGQTLSGERTFEFIHKSFREYLTALRIIRALARIADELERRATSFDAGWDEREALKHWAEICGPNPMDFDLFRFTHNEIKRKDSKDVLRWQEILSRLISIALRNGMPMELLSPRPTFHDEVRQSRNAEEALLGALNACARVTRELSRIGWPDLNNDKFETAIDYGEHASAGAWINKLRGQRTGPNNVLALSCLSFLDLSRCRLYMGDLYNANLDYSCLKNALGSGLNLEEASLNGADLEEVHLFKAELSGARLAGAQLQRAMLKGITLTRADLREANLEEADLEDANLKQANLRDARLKKANLKRANLEGADLEGADLEGAVLEGANLKGVNLKGVSLEGTSLGEPNLHRKRIRK